MNKIYHIRREIMNLTQEQWLKLGKDDFIGTLGEWSKKFGVEGGMFFTAKANDEEKEFIKLLYWNSI